MTCACTVEAYGRVSDVTTPKVFMRNGLTGAWEPARLKKCVTCGIMFQTAQRTKKYCSAGCSPKKMTRKTDLYVEQHVVWVCRLCKTTIPDVLLVKEKRTLQRSDYICDDCLHSHPLDVVFNGVERL